MGIERLLQVDEPQKVTDGRQQRLSNMVSWEVIGFQKHNVDALSRECRSRVRARRTTANNEHLARIGN